MADKTPEQIAAEAKAAADAAEAQANADAKTTHEASLAAKVAQAKKDADDAKSAQDRAKASAQAVSPYAIGKLTKDAAGHPPIAKGERRSFIPVHGPIQNPITLEWFRDQPVKVTVDDWTIGQYYAEEPRLQLSED